MATRDTKDGIADLIVELISANRKVIFLIEFFLLEILIFLLI
jgi:hypothetical protein